MYEDKDTNRKVTVGIDAAITAHHHVVVRAADPGRAGAIVEQFSVPPTLAGLGRLAERLVGYDVAAVTAEPTSMTWRSIAVALEDVGLDLQLVGARHLARLRGAVTGKHKSDVIDAELLAQAPEVFRLAPASMPSASQLALKRACRRRHVMMIDANRSWRRLVSLVRWACPDVFDAVEGHRGVFCAILRRWPDLRALSRAQLRSIIAVIGAHTRGRTELEPIAQAVRDAAAGWVDFWDGHVDLDALTVELVDVLDELEWREARVTAAGAEATRHWASRWGDDDVLLSVPGIGATTAPIVRAWLDDGTRFDNAKQVAAFTGLNPSNWSSGTIEQPSRAITKEGSEQLRLAFYQSANAARTVDPELAAFYRRLMVERGHCHTQANVAVARKLACRTWRTIVRGSAYQFRDLDGNDITRRDAKALAKTITVPDDVRRRARARSAATHRAKLTR